MTRTQIQCPDPLYQPLKSIAERHHWSLAGVRRQAADHFVTGFPDSPHPRIEWQFATLDCGGDFLTDPACLHLEAAAIAACSGS